MNDRMLVSIRLYHSHLALETILLAGYSKNRVGKKNGYEKALSDDSRFHLVFRNAGEIELHIDLIFREKRKHLVARKYMQGMKHELWNEVAWILKCNAMMERYLRIMAAMSNLKKMARRRMTIGFWANQLRHRIRLTYRLIIKKCSRNS